MTGTSRTGGRSARVHDAILRAAAAELDAVGYDAASIGRIAHAAGVSRTTIDRRWPRKRELMGAVVGARATKIRAGMGEPAGLSFEGELRTLVAMVAEALAEQGLADALRGVMAAPGTEADATGQAHWRAREQVLAGVVERAESRGEIPPGVDPVHVGELLTAPLWMRTFATGHPLDRALLDRVVDDVLRRFALPGSEAGPS